ncbi:MAG TPA: translocation/assembly module TamB domain-containing protein [Gracilimonas sp.]|uniref:translocation/assembly module TamB domain-containing protein n=1 Tax=Gracilimonas sp. TaxID=1974203 RepID=UPI002D9F01C7|nr:translocation/assembly module TamB domain-containing protein [Gracilimonas sp.]
MSENRSHIAIRLLKIFGWLVLSLAILLTALRLSLKTSWIHGIAKTQIISIVNNSLNATVSIDEIEGDLWNDFTFHDISVVQKDTLLDADSLNIRFNIWSLLSSSFEATEISLSGFNAYLNETEENHFNVQDLVKEDSSESAFSINIQRFKIDNGSISIYSPTYLPDTTLSVNQLTASASFSVSDEISASLSSLSFQIAEGRLPEPVSVKTSVDYKNNIITLNQLVIETSRSLLKANGFSNLQDSTLSAEANALPLSFKDIQPYLDSELPDEELQLTLKADGNLDSLNLEVQGEGKGFDELLVVSNFTISDTLSLNKFGMTGRNLDIAYFTKDSVDAEIKDFQVSLEGHLDQKLSATDITWGFTFSDIRFEEYYFEILFGSGTLKEQTLMANIQLSDGADTIVLNPDIENLFSEDPDWQVKARFSDINLGWWTNNPELNGEVSFQASAEGEGFTLSEKPWNFSLYKVALPQFRSGSNPFFGEKPVFVKDTIRVGNQNISDLNVTGSISSDSLKTDGFVQLIDNKINFSTIVSNFLNEQPSYTYKLSTSEFDLGELPGFEDFSTSINMAANGEGRYFEPEKIHTNANLVIDSSYVNGASFDLLEFNVALQDYILTLENGTLQSEIIEGSFSGRRNLADRSDPENDFALDMEIKNLQPFAPLVGAEVFNAPGRITGNISEITEGELLFDGNIQLHDIHYDTLFAANSIEGNTKISIREEYGYDLSLNIDQPTFNNITLQDLQFKTVGIATNDSLSGNFDLDIDSEEAGNLSQLGSYALNLQTLRTELNWNTFKFQTPARLLSLQSPFNLIYDNSSIRTDTLKLRSDEGTFLNISIPYADSLRQQVWAQGRDFDFGVIQNIIFDERFVEGILSGNLEIDNAPSSFSGNGSLSISNLLYKDSEVDLINLNFDVISQRLEGNLSVTIDGEEKIAGQIDIPFIPEPPTTLEQTFFEESVSGTLVINPLDLNEFENILNSFEITQTSGILSFNGQLSGTAGEPNFEGIFNLSEPTLSGISIDSAFAKFNYHHLDKKLTALAEINAQGQQAASIDAKIPVSVDFRTFEINMPDDTDSLRFNLLTDNFNLSVFNDFLDKQYLSRLRGSLNADVNVSGTKEKLVPRGFLKLNNAQVAVPIAGITLTEINSELQFSESGLLLNNFKMTSGSGSFTANGSIELEGITPTELNINARASRFKLANTSDYNLTIDLDSKLTGPPTQPKASGVLTIKNGFVYLQDFGEKSVETVELEDEDISTFSPYDSLAIDMRFVIERNFLIRNRRYLDMEVELTGELDAQKQSAGELQLFGTLNAERGYVRPLGKQFSLEEGRFTFSGPIDKPDIYIKTSYIPQTSQKQGDPIILFYIIEGNASDPQFRFESEPQMEQQDIICYTLFNKPCYALESWQQLISGGGSSPSDLLVGVLLDEVETLATQELGIDVVQIETTRSGTHTGTSIKTGWYLNRRTFFAIVNEISGTNPKTMFILEYLLKENLDLIITQGDDNQQGIDLRWQYDY